MNIIDHHIRIHSMMKYEGKFNAIKDKQEILNLVTAYHIKSEIIGSWLYCFTSDLIGVQLLSIGFWFSKKHLVYIYSGDEKEGFADNESLDEIRARLGSEEIISNIITDLF